MATRPDPTPSRARIVPLPNVHVTLDMRPPGSPPPPPPGPRIVPLPNARVISASGPASPPPKPPSGDGDTADPPAPAG